MTNLFWIDWSDPPYPRIRPASEAPNLETELQSLTKCKQNIVEEARRHREHWLEIIKHTRALDASKIYRGLN